MDVINYLKKMLPLLFWLLVWFIISRIINQVLYFPSPIVTIKALVELLGNKNFFLSIISTVSRVFIGLVIANILGILLGLLCGFKKWIFDLMRPMMTFVRSTPVMSLIIIALIWFQSNHVPIFISFLMCFPIIWTNIVEGFKKVDQDLIEMGKIYQISKIKLVKEIYIPSLLPFYIAGFNTALGIAWKVTVAAEVLSHPRFAIGTNLYDSKVYLDTPSLFAWTLVIVILSYFFEIVITNYLNKRLKKYY
ncbi:MAG TPA: ABC transporter permease subunit [Clostridia bacterium]|nr:ABC transporter permease subunit [Clostridia bacterium]